MGGKSVVKDVVVFCLCLVVDLIRSLVAVLVALLTFLPLSAFLGIRYCFRRRRHPEQIAPVTPRPYRVRARRKKPKLMHIDGVNEKFPTMTFKQARLERPAMRAASLADPDETITEIATPQQLDEKAISTTTTTPVVATPSTEASAELPTEVSIAAAAANGPTPGTAAGTEGDADTTLGSVAFEKGPDLEAGPTTGPIAEVVEEINDDSESDVVVDEDQLVAEGVDTDDTCVVCLEQIEDAETVRLLNCGHIFHSECIDPWFTLRRASCPLCKSDYYDVSYDPETYNIQEEETEETAEASASAEAAPHGFHRFFSVLVGSSPLVSRTSTTSGGSASGGSASRGSGAQQDGGANPETDATRRRRAAAIRNIWGRHLPRDAQRAHQPAGREPSDPAPVAALPVSA